MKNQSNQKQYVCNEEVIVVIVPFPAQGHLNQLLHLSRIIATYGIPVHYIGTTTHNRQAKLRVHGWDPLRNSDHNSTIEFHDIEIPKFDSPPPDPESAIKFPSHLQPVWDAASSHLRHPVTKLMQTLSCDARKVVVIYDSMMGSVIQDVVLINNAESYTFNSVSAFACYLYILLSSEKSFFFDDKLKSLVSNDTKIPSLEGCFSNEFLSFIASQYEYQKFSHGHIYNTCRVIEGHFLDMLKLCNTKNHWGLGPFNPLVTILNDFNDDDNNEKIKLGGCFRRRIHSCLEWLDKQDLNSVIYVSFGTTTSMNNQQINEIAHGLKQSGQKFIWVLREADKGDVFFGESNEKVRDEQLPKGYEDSVKGRGLIVRDWAPQLEILAHKATGGFLSHCGWNSCMESISMGVPMAAWPMHSDQPKNTFLISKYLNVGFSIREWDKRDEIVKALDIEKCVKKLMDSKEGNEMRKKACELGGQVNQAMRQGGVSNIEMDSFIAYITRHDSN